MRTIVLILLAQVMLASQLGALPPVVKNILEQESKIFERVMSKLSNSQNQILLDNYAKLIRKSPFAIGLVIDEGELRNELQRRFGNFHAGEGDLKKLKPAATFGEEIDSLLMKLADSMKGEYRGTSLTLKAGCLGAKLDLPIEISEGDTDNEVSLKVLGVGIPKSMSEVPSSGNAYCFEMVLSPKNSTADLEWVGTAQTACPLPTARAGECLLEVADQIARGAGKNEILLIDASDIKCHLNGEETSLQKLKFYQEGRGWYEKHDYKVSDENKTYKSKLASLRAYPLAALLKNLELAPVTLESKPILAEISLQASVYQKLQPNAKAADFMSWLWTNDCRKYIQIETYLNDPLQDVDFANLIPGETFYSKSLK